MGVRVAFPDMGKDPSVQLIEKTITENGTYDAITDGVNGYSKVNVNVEGGGLKTKEINLYEEYPNIKTFIDELADDQLTSTNFEVYVDSIFTTDFYIGMRDVEPYKNKVDKSRFVAAISGTYDGTHVNPAMLNLYSWGVDKNSRPILIIPENWEITNIIISKAQ